MCSYFKTETNVAQNLIDNFFRFNRKDFTLKKYGVTGLISEKTEAFYAKLNERAEAGTISYSATGDFLQYIYSVLLAMSHQKI